MADFFNFTHRIIREDGKYFCGFPARQLPERDKEGDKNNWTKNKACSCSFTEKGAYSLLNQNLEYFHDCKVERII